MLHVHLVFVTKYRRRVFTKAAIDDLREIFDKVCRDFEAELVELDGEEDHVHLLVNYPPKVAVSTLVKQPQGRLLTPPAAAATRDCQALLAGCPVVPELLRGGLRWSTALHHQAVHRKPAHTKRTPGEAEEAASRLGALTSA
jgi:REP element-mobilizing transposase RayT